MEGPARLVCEGAPSPSTKSVDNLVNNTCAKRKEGRPLRKSDRFAHFISIIVNSLFLKGFYFEKQCSTNFI
jgi:hypothetical protein